VSSRGVGRFWVISACNLDFLHEFGKYLYFLRFTNNAYKLGISTKSGLSNANVSCVKIL
jgi:hypothetical protein